MRAVEAVAIRSGILVLGHERFSDVPHGVAWVAKCVKSVSKCDRLNASPPIVGRMAKVAPRGNTFGQTRLFVHRHRPGQDDSPCDVIHLTIYTLLFRIHKGPSPNKGILTP
jgi:hypothetical protein